MKEKKLTDEKIVKALECCTIDEVTDCENCPLVKESCAIIRKYALDLIYRLQSKNEKLLKDYYAASQTCDEQKSEIERLTEENEYLDGCAKQFLADYQKCEVELSEQEDKCLDCPYQLKFNEIEKQAVKDTAKEIYHLIDMFPIPTRQGQQRYATGFENGLTAIKLKTAERYGVEVE